MRATQMPKTAKAISLVLWWIESLRVPLAIVKLIVTRICVGLVFAIVTAQAVLAGGFWLLITPVAGLLALFYFGMAAGFVWLWARGELTGDSS